MTTTPPVPRPLTRADIKAIRVVIAESGPHVEQRDEAGDAWCKGCDRDWPCDASVREALLATLDAALAERDRYRAQAQATAERERALAEGKIHELAEEGALDFQPEEMVECPDGCGAWTLKGYEEDHRNTCAARMTRLEAERDEAMSHEARAVAEAARLKTERDRAVAERDVAVESYKKACYEHGRTEEKLNRAVAEVAALREAASKCDVGHDGYCHVQANDLDTSPTLATAHDERVRAEERERCAKIATDYAAAYMSENTYGSERKAAEQIAAAIRGGKA